MMELSQIAQVGVGMLLLGVGTFFALVGAMSLRVMIDLIRAGPRAADEALETGASLKGWWDGKYRRRPSWLRE